MNDGLVLVADLSASLYIALLDQNGGVLASRIREQGTRGETAHRLLDECLAEIGRAPKNLVEIDVGIGPGSFTGIRVAAAFAEGLAFAARLPIYPFSSLAAARVSARGEAGNATSETSPSPDALALIAANAGRYYAASENPAREALLSSQEVAALAPTHCSTITSGHFPDREKFVALFPTLLRMEECADFAAIHRLAKLSAPILDGIVRPNYLMASAAEEKRRAATPQSDAARAASSAPGAPGVPKAD